MFKSKLFKPKVNVAGVLVCKVCGHETSGPNEASVIAAHKRHEAKMGHRGG